MTNLARNLGPVDLSLPWRVGRSLGISLYLVVGDEPSKEDVFLGQMDTRELAEYVVSLHNREIARGM